VTSPNRAPAPWWRIRATTTMPFGCSCARCDILFRVPPCHYQKMHDVSTKLPALLLARRGRRHLQLAGTFSSPHGSLSNIHSTIFCTNRSNKGACSEVLIRHDKKSTLRGLLQNEEGKDKQEGKGEVNDKWTKSKRKVDKRATKSR